MDLHFEAISDNTKRVLFLLNDKDTIKKFYLAGGTALALQLGHRISNDLDFFSQNGFDENFTIQRLAEMGNFQLEKRAEQTIIGILNDTKVSFFDYNYPLLKEPENIGNIRIADVSDVACMKIDAIASRGTKRDFIDVYFIAKNVISLGDIFVNFEKKFSSLNYNMIHIKKSLVFFEDAEDDASPQMLRSVGWEDVKKFFEDEIVKIN